MKRYLKTLLLSLLTPALLTAAAGMAGASVFPAPSTDEAGVTRWGYLGDGGKKVTDFIYSSASEFDASGLAAVTNEEGGFALVGRDGEPVTDWLEMPRSAESDGTYKALDYGKRIDYYDSDGQLAGSIEGAVGFPGDGLVVTGVRSGRRTVYGYTALQPEGQEEEAGEEEALPAAEEGGEPAEEEEDSGFAIPPQYQAAGAFRKGRALVQTETGAYAVINTRGLVLKELPEGAVPTALDIYADTTVILEMQGKYALYSLDSMQFATTFAYDEILPFDRGAARCRSGNLWGLITPSGSVVMEPTYPYLSYMGEGVYAARGTDQGAAAVSETGRVLYTTGTYVGGFQTFSHGLSWHGSLDGSVVFFNARGTLAAPLHGVENPQVMTSRTARVTRDGAESYVDIYTGETIYRNARSYPLDGGLTITAESYEKYLGMRADGTEYGYHVEYPQLSGLEDEGVQATINDALRSFFVSGPAGAKDRSLEATFGFSVEGQVLVVWASGVSGLDDAATAWCESIGLDLTTGARYTAFESLFNSSAPSVLAGLLPEGPPYYESPRMDAGGVTFFCSYPAEKGAEPYTESVRLTYEELAQAIDFDSACYRALSGFQGVVFEDVPFGHWAFAATAEVAHRGWMQGSDGKFRPGSLLTGAEAVATAARALSLPAGVMPQLPAGAWYAADAGAAWEAGLLEGFEEPWLHLREPLGRAGAMQLLANALLRRGAQLPGDSECAALLAAFSDGASVPEARRTAAALCVREGLVQGSGGALRPHDAFTRAEFAQVLMNFAGWAG